MAMLAAACAGPTPPRLAATPAKPDTSPPPLTVMAAPTGVLSLREPPAKSITTRPVIGRDAQDVAAQFGTPDFRRSEPPGELWQYRGADCVLDVFLLREGDTYRVIRSAVRDRHVDETAGRCSEALFMGSDNQARPGSGRNNAGGAPLFPD